MSRTGPVALTVVGEGDPGGPPAHSQVSAFCSPRRALWGVGEAARITLPAPWIENTHLVHEALSGFEVDDQVDEPGTGPVAFGSLPFDPKSAATLVVPKVIHGYTSEGISWTTTIDGPTSGAGSNDGVTEDCGAEDRGAELGATELGVTDPSSIHASSIQVSSVRSPEDWCDSVDEARKRIIRGDFIKVVLAREIALQMDHPVDPASLLERLRAMYPASMCFAVDGFVGASPELLVSRIGEIVRAHPMAGTTPRSGEPEADQRRAAELLASDKNRIEHQITIDMVHDMLLRWSSYLDAEPTPSVVQAGPVQHLATMVEGRLSQPNPSVLELVAALHPTPAVGGWPRDAALRAIEELEQAERGPYAGPVGWVDASGNGSFAVGIRSVLLQDKAATLFAGVGVVADSDPQAELEETRAKSQALLGALIRV
ncbi:MAG TPA: isochorismate synthase [Microthrixaceae bacterium]|nr:isochorismate synthase [Microthrixaceae bacterium]